MEKVLKPYEEYSVLFHPATNLPIGFCEPRYARALRTIRSVPAAEAKGTIEALIASHKESVRTGDERTELDTLVTRIGHPVVGYAQRDAVHQLGLYHRVVAALIVRKDISPGEDPLKAWFMGERSDFKDSYRGQRLPLIGEHSTIDDGESPRVAIKAALNEELKVTDHPPGRKRTHHDEDIYAMNIQGIMDSSKGNFRNREHVTFFVYECPYPFTELLPDPREWNSIEAVDFSKIIGNDLFRKYTGNLFIPGQEQPKNRRGMLYTELVDVCHDHDPALRKIMLEADRKKEK